MDLLLPLLQYFKTHCVPEVFTLVYSHRDITFCVQQSPTLTQLGVRINGRLTQEQRLPLNLPAWNEGEFIYSYIQVSTQLSCLDEDKGIIASK